MKIKEILRQNRRDFHAIFECEHCGVEIEKDGYDDTYFHQRVIPAMKCASCGKVAGPSYRALAPKHPDGAVV